MKPISGTMSEVS